jgi:hypothetical protein
MAKSPSFPCVGNSSYLHEQSPFERQRGRTLVYDYVSRCALNLRESSKNGTGAGGGGGGGWVLTPPPTHLSVTCSVINKA